MMWSTQAERNRGRWASLLAIDLLAIGLLAGVLLLAAGPPARADDDSSVLAPGATPVRLQERGAGEGPAWSAQLGLLTSGGGHIMRRSREGEVSIYLKDAGSNGLRVDREGRLLICQPSRRRVVRREADGTLTVLAADYQGQRFNQPNDLALDSKGRIYFSDPRYGDRSDMELVDQQGRKVEGVYRIDPDGQVTRIITHEVDRPNGLVVSDGDQHLFVASKDGEQAVEGARNSTPSRQLAQPQRLAEQQQAVGGLEQIGGAAGAEDCRQGVGQGRGAQRVEMVAGRRQSLGGRWGQSRGAGLQGRAQDSVHIEDRRAQSWRRAQQVVRRRFGRVGRVVRLGVADACLDTPLALELLAQPLQQGLVARTDAVLIQLRAEDLVAANRSAGEDREGIDAQRPAAHLQPAQHRRRMVALHL